MRDRHELPKLKGPPLPSHTGYNIKAPQKVTGLSTRSIYPDPAQSQ